MAYRSLFSFAALVFISANLAIIGNLQADDELAGDRVFGTAKIVPLQLTMSDDEFVALKPAGGGAFGPPGFGPPREPLKDSHRNTFGIEFPWAHGDLAFDGQTFHDIGVRYKGNYTFMASARSLKKSLKLDLNRNIDGQKLDGLTMLNLHCGVSDPSLARESLSFQFFRDAGVPAPRTSIAELTLTVPGKYDGEFVGVYTLTEQVNKAFLKRHFGDGTGMLLKPEGLQGGPAWLGPDWKAYEDRFRPEDKPSEDQKRRLIEFANLISNSTDAAFFAGIESYLDVDAFLNFVAANALLSNLDSYLGYGHNYYLYLVPATNRFEFIPWDLDVSLATWPAVGSPEQLVELSITHPHAGDDKLIDRLLASEPIRERYLSIIRNLCSTFFTREKLLSSLEQIEVALREPMGREAIAAEARKEGRGGSRSQMGFGGGQFGGGQFGGGQFGGGQFGGGQFGLTMLPREFIEKRTESVAAQLEGTRTGFVPRPFNAGFGGPRRGGFGGPRPR